MEPMGRPSALDHLQGTSGYMSLQFGLGLSTRTSQGPSNRALMVLIVGVWGILEGSWGV